MKAAMNKVRTHLGQLGQLAAKTEASERKILESALKRLEVVQRAIQRARPGVEAASDGAQDRYLELVKERGQLELVIARAREVLVD